MLFSKLIVPLVAGNEVERHQEAETLAIEETKRRRELEAELEQLRANLANRQDEKCSITQVATYVAQSV